MLSLCSFIDILDISYNVYIIILYYSGCGIFLFKGGFMSIKWIMEVFGF